MNYQEYIQSPDWQNKADAAKARAGYRCQICNQTGKLEAHHRTYERLGEELDDDITVLCDKCHALYSVQTKRIGWFLDPIEYKPMSFEALLSRNNGN